jgi:hypothetical protein
LHATHPRIIQLLSRRIALGARHKRWLYAALVAVWVTGLAWVAIHFAPVHGADADDARRGFEAWALRLHGAAAFGFLVAMGSMFTNHIPRAWYLRRNVGSGSSILGVATVLVVTGYALYYFATEESHAWLSVVHWSIGLAAIAVVPLHVWLGHRGRAHPPGAE